jgi:hypothetical protein
MRATFVGNLHPGDLVLIETETGFIPFMFQEAPIGNQYRPICSCYKGEVPNHLFFSEDVMLATLTWSHARTHSHSVGCTLKDDPGYELTIAQWLLDLDGEENIFGATFAQQVIRQMLADSGGLILPTTRKDESLFWPLYKAALRCFMSHDQIQATVFLGLGPAIQKAMPRRLPY